MNWGFVHTSQQPAACSIWIRVRIDRYGIIIAIGLAVSFLFSFFFFLLFGCRTEPEALFGWLPQYMMWHWCVSPLNEQIWQDSRLVCGCLFPNQNPIQNQYLEGCSFGDDRIKSPRWRWWVHCLQGRLSQDLSLVWFGYGKPWHWLSEGKKLIAVQPVWIRN